MIALDQSRSAPAGVSPLPPPSPLPIDSAFNPQPSALPTPHPFLAALHSKSFNDAAATQSLPADQFLSLATDPNLRAQLESIQKFQQLCSAIRAASLRSAALTGLAAALAKATDPVEMRRAATALLRATDPVRPRASDATPSPGSSADAWPRPKPARHLSANDVVGIIVDALDDNNNPEENSGLATIADFCAPTATLNGEALPMHNRQDCIQALEESTLLHCVDPAVSLHYAPAQHQIGQPGGGRYRPRTSRASCRVPFSVAGFDKPVEVAFSLVNDPKPSRHRDCWLISRIDAHVPPDPTDADPAPNTS